MADKRQDQDDGQIGDERPDAGIARYAESGTMDDLKSTEVVIALPMVPPTAQPSRSATRWHQRLQIPQTIITIVCGIMMPPSVCRQSEYCTGIPGANEDRGS